MSAPPGLWERFLPAMAYDSARGRIVLFGGGTGYISYRDTWEYDGVAWTPGPPAPAALTWRYGHAMVYDAGRGRMVMFGGYEDFTNVLHDDTWEYDGTSWTAGPTAPVALTPRWAHGMAFDTGRGITVLFGGEDYSTLLNDTWEYDGSSWVAGPAAPPALTPRQFHAMGYHAGIGKVVLFGGPYTGPPLNDTWEYDGASWTPGPVAPPGLTPRYGAGMAYDATRGVIVLFGGAWGGGMNDTWELDGASWTMGPPAPVGLTPRYFVGMAFDSARSKTVVFGGSSGPAMNDTWEYDGTAWAQGPVAPYGVRPRSFLGMAYDSARSKTVIFGGSAGISLNDSWDFDGSAWSQGPPAPPALVPRWLQAMAYDAGRARTVLFGGADDSGLLLDDTWEQDGSSWQAGPPAPASLGGRAAHALAYDASRGRVVLFGGLDNASVDRDDTWEYDGSTWMAGPPPPPGMVGRHYHAMAFDQGVARVVLYGGWNGTVLDDTWLYDGVSWTAGPPAPPGLSARYWHAMAGDTARGRVVLFGGYSSPTLIDTWEFDGTGWVAGPLSPAGLGRRAGHAMAYDSARDVTVLFGSGTYGDTWEYSCPVIQLAPPSLPPGTVGTFYWQGIVASGGSSPYAFSVTAGSLPPGINLSSTGVLSGTPTQAGAFAFTITAADAFVCRGSRPYVMTAGCPAIGLSPASLPSASEGVVYAATLTAVGGTPPYAFAVTAGVLPPGLSLAPAGAITGTPGASGAYAFTVTATDARGCSGARAYLIEILDLTDYVVGAGHGAPNANRIRAFTTLGSATTVDFLAYAAGAWGVNVGAGDIDGGQDDEILAGPGPGGALAPQVRGFGRTGAPLAKVNYYAYGTLRYGVCVASGSIDPDSYSEILSGPGPGAVFGPHVRGWNYDASALSAVSKVSFFAYATPRYGVNVAGSDVDGDGFAEILTGPGPGVAFAPHVRGFDFDGATLAAVSGCSFYAFAGIGYGAWIAGGDVDGDGAGEIVAAPGPGGNVSFPPRFLGFKLTGSAITTLPGFDATPLLSRYGGRPGTGDISLDGVADLITASGPDPSTSAIVTSLQYTGTSLTLLPGTFVAFPSYTYGASVASGHIGF